jgi:hypothetical protein
VTLGGDGGGGGGGGGGAAGVTTRRGLCHCGPGPAWANVYCVKGLTGSVKGCQFSSTSGGGRATVTVFGRDDGAQRGPRIASFLPASFATVGPEQGEWRERKRWQGPREGGSASPRITRARASSAGVQAVRVANLSTGGSKTLA